MRLIGVMAALAVCGTALAAGHPAPASAPAPAASGPAVEYRPEEWTGPVEKARQQLDTLSLFAKASHFGGITVKIPAELQQVPLAALGLPDLQKKGVELYVKEFTFRDLDFSREERTLWVQTHPLLPALMRFSTLGASVELKTKVGVIPLGATFHDGVIPFDFDLRKDGYDLGLLPERRAGEARLGRAHLRVGGPVATGIANAFFTDEVARLVLKYGVGQTLKMNENGLFSGATGASFLKTRSDSIGAEAVKGLIGAAPPAQH